jgi:iron-sulfur cluster assembly protein
MIALTEKAADQIRRMMNEQKLSPTETGLRVGVKPAGCSGLAYSIDFDSAAKEGDQVATMHGIKVFVDAAAAAYLDGTEIDWKGGLLGSGFQFRNPNATRSCGCGESFSV